MAYVVRVYECSTLLPVEERYNLVAQLRKAALSVPLNIAEGAGCATPAEFARFLGYAYRSLKETMTCLELWQRLYPGAAQPSVIELVEEGEQIARMTYALIQRVTGN